ncbi:MAG: HPF/RaiA family ribosome-associated protein [Polyangiaceae bacterium]
MNKELQITFRGLDPSEFIDSYVRKRAEKLERFADHIVGCHVVIESPHHHKSHGGHFKVMIDLKLPGDEIVVGNHHRENKSHEDVYATIDDAFEDVTRVLQERLRKRRGD